jgi:anti-sigma factor RsiW
MSESEQVTPDDRDKLVSYLDGELDEQSARSMEAELARNPELRQELESLQRTWDMLDYLPRPTAPADFTHKTLERLETRQLAQVRSRRLRRFAGAMVWLGGAAAAAAIGFLAVSSWPRPELPAPSADDIRLLEHREYWHHYQKIDSIEFLKELERSGLFSEDAS